MEEKDTTLIEKYFAQELSVQEKSAIDERLTRDTEFAKEFEAYGQAMDAIRFAQREELKNRFRERDRVLDQRNKPMSSNRRYFLLLAAALIVMVLGIWVLNNNRETILESEIASPPDTLQTKGLSENPDDTIKYEEKVPMAATEKKDDKKWQTAEVRGEELFAANFEPYMDESLDGTVRGDQEDMSPEERFLSSYSEGQYDVTVEMYGEMSEVNRQNPDFQFLYANALLAQGLTNEAIKYLMAIDGSNSGNYSQEVKYYLGLAYLNKGELLKSKESLVKYLEIRRAKNNQKAKEILRVLK